MAFLLNYKSMVIEDMSKVGILTFHVPQNCGAVLQAYALQNIILDLGYECKIIDLKRKSQIDFYSSQRNGLKSKIKEWMLCRYGQSRKLRTVRFDNFVNNHLVLTDETYTNEIELIDCQNNFNTFVVGSDQIWNPLKKSCFTTAYMLDFVVEKNKKKIAYAPSIGVATYEDINQYRDLLLRFDELSCREHNGSKILSEVCKKKVMTVLDPTLLVDSKHLESIIPNIFQSKSKFIFYYSLDGFDKRKNNIDILKVLADKFGYKVIAHTPEWPKYGKGIKNVQDAGPEEFLWYIKNAEFVCTNSFHGTALSIAFQKSFYVLEDYDGKDDRKLSILKELEMVDRLIWDEEQARAIGDYVIDYTIIGKKLEALQSASKNYLVEALKG